MRPAPGYTLVEVLTVLVVLSIIAAMALPNYQSFVLTQRVRSASYDLMSSLIFARSEAIKRNSSVTITKSASWDQGWTIAAGATTLRTQAPYSNIAITDSASLAAITYGNDGRLAGAATAFTIGSGASAQVLQRCVTISLGGLPSSKLGSC